MRAGSGAVRERNAENGSASQDILYDSAQQASALLWIGLSCVQPPTCASTLRRLGERSRRDAEHRSAAHTGGLPCTPMCPTACQDLAMTKLALLTSAALLAAASAFAQTGATTSPTPPSPSQFLTQQSPGQWRASKLVGVDVYGTDNAKIGDIREVLLNRNGAAEAVVIGVGGFLGIGEKDVAVPFSAVEWVTEATSVAAPGAAPEAAPETLAPPPVALEKGSGNSAQAGRTAAAGSRGYPDRAVLHMTKADLQNAPTFRYASNTRAATTAPATRTNPPATANPPTNVPRQ